MAAKTQLLGKDFVACKLWEMRDYVFHALLNLGTYPDETEQELNEFIPYPKEFYQMWHLKARRTKQK